MTGEISSFIDRFRPIGDASLLCLNIMVRLGSIEPHILTTKNSDVGSDESRHGVPLVERSVQSGTFKKFSENFHQVFDPEISRASYMCA